MSRGFAFLFGVHCHQPVGNFGSVFERAFADSYRPFLEAMRRHPGVRFTAHYSGPLLEYMRNRERGCWDVLRELVARGQAELLGGGFFEPVLAVIPEEDRQGQLRMMGDFLEEHFGRRPRGVWLTERVWEPSLPRTLARAGVEYTLVDEEHFHQAGVSDLHAYYLTEDEGLPLAVFPIDKALRYLIPFRGQEDVERYLAGLQARGGLAILGDDGEKFGLWPGTKRRVYEEGWLERFLGRLEDNALPTMTYAEALDSRPAAGRVYLPPASYEEMMGWVLEPEAAERYEALKKNASPEDRRFLRGGFFREFFLKYPESHHLRARMLSVSRRIAEAGRTEGLPELYKAQGNDPYWHGVFGGLYLPHLREAAYEHLLNAERTLVAADAWREEDFDFDGSAELAWQAGRFGLFLKPSAGGSLVEVDDIILARNLTDVLARRRETYHAAKAGPSGEGLSIHELSKKLPEGSERLLRYDRRSRRSWVGHFLGPEVTADDFASLSYDELGDFPDAAYRPAVRGRDVHLWLQGLVGRGESAAPVGVEKMVSPEERRVVFRTSVRNAGPAAVSLVFAEEWNVYQIPGEWRADGDKVWLCGERLVLSFAPSPEIWAYPLETLSQSEEGFEVIHQGYCLTAVWRFNLEPGSNFEAVTALGEGHVV